MHWEYVFAGYGIVFASLVVYVVSVLYRGRELSRQVPDDRRRFLD